MSDYKNMLLKDIREAMEFSDLPRVFESIEAHIEDQVSDDEAKMMLELAMGLEPRTYDDWDEFCEDYQAILDLVDFPIMDAVSHARRHQFKSRNLDKFR